MLTTKVVVVGAGSFVFGPSMLDQAFLQHRLNGLDMVLVDPDREIVELMAAVGTRMVRERGLSSRVTAHVERETALHGADFVICSAARQIHRRFEMDCEIIDRFAPGHLVSEFGGIQGISYSLRQIALIQEIASDMRRLCPQAWLLNASNPLPRVTQAAHECGIRTVGFCSVSSVAYGSLWRLFGNDWIEYPYTAARERWKATMAGLNHFSWVTSLQDRISHKDALPEMRERIQGGATSGNPRAEALARETGYLLAPPDHHTHDFLAPQAADESRIQPSHGTPLDRGKRLTLLRAVAEGTEDWAPLLAHGAWERPIDLVAAVAYGRRAEFNSLNLVNTGQIPNLPLGVVVETPAYADEAGPHAETVVLPESILSYCRDAARVTDTIVRAARERKIALVNQAVELDPTIQDKAAGREAIEVCLEAHLDLLGDYE